MKFIHFKFLILSTIFTFFFGCATQESASKNTKKEIKNEFEITIIEAIDKCKDYLDKNLIDFYDDQAVMSAYLVAKQFNVDLDFPDVKTFKNLKKNVKENYFRLYGRSYGYSSDLVVEADIVQEHQLLEIMDQFKSERSMRNLLFLLCRKIETPSFAIDSFKSMLTTDSKLYAEWLFHLHNIKETSCFAEQIDLDNESNKAIEKTIEQINTNNLDYESLAMLAYYDRHDILSKETIENVIANQLDNGGWSNDVNSRKPSESSTVYAFWLLLDYLDSIAK